MNPPSICYSAVSPPSKPRPSHPLPWAPDGREPSSHFSSPINAIIRVTFSIERDWMPPSSSRSGGGTRRLIRREEPTGLVPSGPGAEGGIQAHSEIITLLSALPLAQMVPSSQKLRCLLLSWNFSGFCGKMIGLSSRAEMRL